MKNNLSKKEFLSVSVMLFGLFFGAGNLIFPPLLGNKAGSLTLVSLIAFSLTAVLFPILGIVVVSKTNGLSNLSKKVGLTFSTIFSCLIYLAIGPGLGIPRAGSLPFEMVVAPYISQNSSILAFRLGYTFLFFLVAYLICLTPSKLVTRMGKFLTPTLLVLITIMFLAVLFKSPVNIALPSDEYKNSAVIKGFLEGYNTMDTIAALNFGLVISIAIKSFNIKEEKVVPYTIKAGFLSGFVLFIVYAMLSYIGMSTSTLNQNAKNGAEILSNTVRYIFGDYGIILLALVFTLACLTTCVGLITSVSQYFKDLTKSKISYHKWIAIWSVLSFLIANFGLNTILKVSVPVLVSIYPVSIVLILLGLTDKYFNYDKLSYKLICYTTVVVSLVEGLQSAKINIPFVTDLVSKLPLYSISLGWVLPAFICWIFSVAYSKLICRQKAVA